MLYEDADGETPLGRRRPRRRSRSAGGRAATCWRSEIAGAEVLVLGDASRPADFVSAINAGADAGLAV